MRGDVLLQYHVITESRIPGYNFGHFGQEDPVGAMTFVEILHKTPGSGLRNPDQQNGKHGRYRV